MAGPQKGRADYLQLGDYNAACSMCGRKRKASTLVKNWQGLFRCPEHNEPRQPQDFARGIKEVISPPWAQIETNQFVPICTYNGLSAIPFFAEPGCSIPGRTIINLDLYDESLRYLEADSTGKVITVDQNGLFPIVVPRT